MHGVRAVSPLASHFAMDHTGVASFLQCVLLRTKPRLPTCADVNRLQMHPFAMAHISNLNNASAKVGAM